MPALASMRLVPTNGLLSISKFIFFMKFNNELIRPAPMDGAKIWKIRPAPRYRAKIWKDAKAPSCYCYEFFILALFMMLAYLSLMIYKLSKNRFNVFKKHNILRSGTTTNPYMVRSRP